MAQLSTSFADVADHPSRRWLPTEVTAQARCLSRAYDELGVDEDIKAPVPCAALLTEIATRLADIFGRSRQVSIVVSAEPILLPASVRRALLLTRVPGGHYSGTLTAIDPRTNRIAWQNKLTNMCIGGTLATAGGLVFIGDGDGTFRAYSTRDGKARWSFQTGAGVNAPPITYAVDGKQYIAVASGGSWQLNFPRGDTLWVFALDGFLPPAKPQPVEPRTVLTSRISIKRTGFTPSRLVVQPGTAITWTNDTDAPQRVTARLGEWRSDPIAPGKSFTHIFRLEGAFDFVAPSVPGLLGTIIVSDHADKPGGQ